MKTTLDTSSQIRANPSCSVQIKSKGGPAKIITDYWGQTQSECHESGTET